MSEDHSHPIWATTKTQNMFSSHPRHLDDHQHGGASYRQQHRSYIIHQHQPLVFEPVITLTIIDPSTSHQVKEMKMRLVQTCFPPPTNTFAKLPGSCFRTFSAQKYQNTLYVFSNQTWYQNIWYFPQFRIFCQTSQRQAFVALILLTSIPQILTTIICAKITDLADRD